jgi:uncharacterized protein YndB with AHSA1/START domain
MSASEAQATRSIDIEITIDAPVEAVWEALSKGDQIAQWFAPNARVEPGVGGSIWLSWGAGAEGTGRIEVWEPNRRLVWSEDHGGPTQIMVDFEIEGSGGSTKLRMVNSGFGASANWDEQYEATKTGWTYFLFHLAFYVVRHRGRVRRMISSRRKTNRPVADVWRALMGPDGLGVADVKTGQQHEMHLDGANAGTVQIRKEPRAFAATIESLNDGLMFVEMEAGSPDWHVGTWLSVYGLPDEKVSALQSALDSLMDAVIPA